MLQQPSSSKRTVLSVAFAAVLGTSAFAGPALAAETPLQQTPAQQTPARSETPDVLSSHTRQIHGTVKSVSGSTFVVDTEKYGAVTVSFTASTPRGRSAERRPATAGAKAKAFEAGKLADLKAGDRVVVQGTISGSTFNARRVHVLPPTTAAARTTHVVGTVESTTATSVTVKKPDGTTVTVAVDASTKLQPTGKTLADLAKGLAVTVVVRDSKATGISLKA
ncbi:MAG: hypothetical protein HYX52_09790 [Chloroflexi bacterium]|nr:hypothetical protein [Chloroflexota bacterium]